MKGPLPRFYAITDRSGTDLESLVRAIAAACRGGLRMVQVREKLLPEEDVAALIARIRAVLPPGALVIANSTGRGPRFSARAGADGAHIGGGDLEALARAREALPAEAPIGYSAHSAPEIAEAARRGADYVSLSPVFEPSSKESRLPPLGIDALREACRSAPIPVFALGGIGPGNIALVAAAGAWGAASIGAILHAADPEEAARAMISEFSGIEGNAKFRRIP